MTDCKICKKSFEVVEEDKEFYAKLGKALKLENPVPKPQMCPTCREQQRYTFRNERYYYNAKCGLCQKAIVSVYNPEFHKNVYCHNCWWSEKWDARDYGREYDSNQPFFEQYKELLDAVPKLAMMNDDGSEKGSENCEYTYDFQGGKNCYLMIGTWYVHDCMYGFQNNRSRDCYDTYFVNESELVYDSLCCEKCYDCQECQQCESCRHCVFGYDLKNCKDCLLCVGLRNKSFCIGNQQYSEEEYKKRKAAFKFEDYQSREELRKKFSEFRKNFPQKYANLVNCENCTGNNLVNCKNSKECFNQRDLHDCKWMTNGDGGKDSYECYSTGGPELCNQCITPDYSYAEAWSIYCWRSKFVLYSENCHTCENLFGCVGIKHGKFCILNKEYDEKAYFELQNKIIREMSERKEFGEFFPSNLSPFAYNETVAMEWYPLSEKEALRAGFHWQKELPGAYGKANGKEIFDCVKCGRSYKIQQKEFEFYKRGNIPLPKLCIDCRYYRRKNLMNSRVLCERECMCNDQGHGHADGCSEKFWTTFRADRVEKIYCKKCYEKVVY